MAEDSCTDLTEFAKKAAACDSVRFTFTDINGLPRTKLVPGPETSHFIQNGVTSCALVTAIGTQAFIVFPKEVTAINSGNATAMPDPKTFHEVTWSSKDDFKIGEVLCETRWLQDNTPQAACPRYVARKQLEALEKLGYKLQSTFELEFSLLNPKTLLPVFPLDFMCRSTILDYEELFSDLSKNVNAGVGIHVETIQTEYSQGQIEITTRREEGIRGADATFIMKQAIKDVCRKNNLLATFMTRPYNKKELVSSNGQHYNHSLWTLDNQNAFSDPNGEYRLSEIARHWIGGLIKHAGALTALCSPTVNCYRRLHAPWAADKANWGLDDRFVSFRVKNYSKEATYMENRIPGGSCNSYLALAATVAAGIDGIKTKAMCPPPRNADAKDLPFTLGEALAALRDDHVMCEALGQQFIDWFILTKNEAEITKLEQDLSKDEFSRERDFYLML